MDYNIYCVSNAGSNTDVKNTLNSFTNLFPQNLDLKNREWEIGIVSMGLHYNYNQLTMTKGQIGVIMLKNELTSINSSEEVIKTEILDQTKSVWVLPDLDEEDLTIYRLMQYLMQYIYKEGMKLTHADLKSDGENKRVYIIECYGHLSIYISSYIFVHSYPPRSSSYRNIFTRLLAHMESRTGFSPT